LKRFIQVPLEVAVAQSITFFMLGVLVWFVLKALIR
jgi:hypothetical protein